MDQKTKRTRRSSRKASPWDPKCVDGEAKEALLAAIRLHAALLLISRLWSPVSVSNALGVKGRNTVSKHAAKLLRSMTDYQLGQLIGDIPGLISDVEYWLGKLEGKTNGRIKHQSDKDQDLGA